MFDRVAKITPSNLIKEVGDLVDQPDHRFIGNGFVCHNSDLKYLEYSMFGFPSVVSNVPAYQGSVHRKRGLLVRNTTGEWVRGIEALVTRQNLRNSLGLSAKAYVEGHRAIHLHAHRWAAAFREALAVRRRKLELKEVRT